MGRSTCQLMIRKDTLKNKSMNIDNIILDIVILLAILAIALYGVSGADVFGRDIIFKTADEYYLNSNKIILGSDNSIYDIKIYDGKIYVPDYRNNKVVIISNQIPNNISAYDVLSPHGIALSNEGHLFVATYNARRILCFKNNMSEMIEWDRGLVACEDFKLPVAIACKGGNVYIACYYPGSIYKLDMDGEIIKTRKLINQNGDYAKIHSISISNDGKIYVAERGEGKILIINSDLNIEAEYRFDNIIVDPLSAIEYGENILFANYIDSRIYVINKNGNIIGRSQEIGFNGFKTYPTNMALDANGSLLVCEEKSNRIARVKNGPNKNGKN